MYRNRSNGEVQQIYLESGINAYLMRKLIGQRAGRDQTKFKKMFWLKK